MKTLDIQNIRAQFPILQTEVRGKPLVYLDNAATTQKPRVVIERIQKYYESENANIHRAVHYLSEVATRRTEEARVIIARFLNAPDAHEIIFTRGCTDGINLVAGSWGRANIGAGDEIILSAMEHHSNIVPWQILAAEKGATIKVAPINDDGELLLDEFEALFSERTKLVSIVHVSNSLGTINPVREIIEMAHARGVLVLLDAAQAVPHLKVDVQDLKPDFLVFSGHKLYGPTGIGVLWARREILEAMPPYQGGGDMISSVKWSGSTWNELPYKFEAGTPNMEGAIGLASAIEWVEELGLENIAAHENELLQRATDAVKDFPGLTIIGRAREKASVLSFVIEGAHPNDIGTLLDARGVAIRTGHHCTQPLMDRFGIPATARASFAVYNTESEVDKFIEALHFAREMLL
ncbi:cysteine desulfurase / selenocysteine lyase [Abditibacterium utsteinense]|uniref:Probable cysteine desulfurase n=1 Tax=Abditibacterium utsteinense TaxID=1960156 RepID=A0A2S8SWP9_9BACT|nr:cysteine desulfurase [Abditibacterium utsteinense]PQV65225.1 cysteine desulfurase / selenocysteine lyase [Abditibacterium utsteinense]